MDPAPDRIVVFADEEHEGEFAVSFSKALGYEVVPIEQRSPLGVPLLTDLFTRAEQMGDIPCYVNADIILESDLVPALKRVAESFPLERWTNWLAAARRWNVQMLDHLDFSEGWQGELKEKVELQGSLMTECAIDLFAWKPGTYHEFKPYAIGRYRWDNWLIGNALGRGAAVVDISGVCRLTHQSHHIRDWYDPDAQANFKIVGAFCGLKDSTHTLTAEGLERGWRG